jgi:hypothetical protein
MSAMPTRTIAAGSIIASPDIACWKAFGEAISSDFQTFAEPRTDAFYVSPHRGE